MNHEVPGVVALGRGRPVSWRPCSSPTRAG